MMDVDDGGEGYGTGLLVAALGMGKEGCRWWRWGLVGICL